MLGEAIARLGTYRGEMVVAPRCWGEGCNDVEEEERENGGTHEHLGRGWSSPVWMFRMGKL